MTLITFTSDFGYTDHYVAAVKAAILSKVPHQVIVDISHSVRRHDIQHAATVVKNVFKDFPKKSIHIVDVNSVNGAHDLIAIEMENHYFIGYDSGLFSLLDSSKPTLIRKLSHRQSSFPAKDVFSTVAIDLASDIRLENIGEKKENLFSKNDYMLKITKSEIEGNVVAVDHFGNLITNIGKSDFDDFIEKNAPNLPFAILVGRERFSEIHTNYSDVRPPDCFLLFNSSGVLEIGICDGNASQLLGLNIDAPIFVRVGRD